jgi:predicted ATPase
MSPAALHCQGHCHCRAPEHEPRFVVVTGGPGAGKTALLELARRHLCSHVVVLPEAASILFGGGFPRHPTDANRRAAQRAIFYIERELERLARAEPRTALVLCDRGSVDGAAYWPGPEAEMWAELQTTREAEFARYATVIHLATPPAGNGYDHSNPLRTETAAEALAIDARIRQVWSGHPRVLDVPHAGHFLDKVSIALEHIRAELPPCCRQPLRAGTSQSERSRSQS